MDCNYSSEFYVLLTVHLGIIFVNNQLDAQFFLMYVYFYSLHVSGGPGSSVGIPTDYGLDGPGIESRWGRDFLPFQTGPGAHPASCTMGTGSFPGVKCGRGVLLTTHLLLAPRS